MLIAFSGLLLAPSQQTKDHKVGCCLWQSAYWSLLAQGYHLFELGGGLRKLQTNGPWPTESCGATRMTVKLKYSLELAPLFWLLQSLGQILATNLYKHLELPSARRRQQLEVSGLKDIQDRSWSSS